MRATRLGRWARRAAVVLVLGFGAATVGGSATYAESTRDISSVPLCVSGSTGTSTISSVIPDESSWD